MEYRSADTKDYTLAVTDHAAVQPGIYYVRRAGNDHYAPSADTELLVPDGEKLLTVTWSVKPKYKKYIEISSDGVVTKKNGLQNEKADPGEGEGESI